MKSIKFAVVLMLIAQVAGAQNTGGAKGMISDANKTNIKIPAVQAPVKVAVKADEDPLYLMLTMKWKTVLKSKKTSVIVYCGLPGVFTSKGKIIVGDNEFKLNQKGQGRYSGFRKVEVNGEITVDQNVQVMTFESLSPEFTNDPVGAAEQAGLSNIDEIKCSQGDAFVLISDNITGEMYGNCMTRKKK